MQIKEELRKTFIAAIYLLWFALILGPVAWAVIRFAELSGAKSSDIAAWVQAVGSIAAIVAAGAIANWQMRVAEKSREREQKDRNRAAVAVIQSAYEWAKSLGELASQRPPDFVVRGSWQLIHEGNFDVALMSLRGINAHEFGKKELVISFFGIMGALQSMRATMVSYMSVQPSMSANMEAYETLITQSKLAEHAWLQFEAAADR